MRRWLSGLWMGLLLGVSLLGAEVRTWVLTDGTRVEASVARVTATMVVLDRAEGGRMLLSRDRLSPPDEAYLARTSGVAPAATSPGATPSARPSPPVRPSPPTRPTPPSRATPNAASPGAPSARSPGESRGPSASLTPPDDHPGLGLVERGEVPPPLRFRHPETGDAMTLEDLRGRLTVVQFWSPQVNQSMTEMVNLRDLRASVGPELFHLVSVGVHLSQKGAIDLLRKTHDSELPFSVGDPMMSIAERWGAAAMPTNAIVDENGILLYEHLYVGQIVALLRERFAR